LSAKEDAEECDDDPDQRRRVFEQDGEAGRVFARTEWIASETMAELPVKPAATNFVAAIARFPSIAA
jgi:hypothetical protein